MVMTGMEKLQDFKCYHPGPVQLYALENVGNDLEDNLLPLVGQFFLTLACDLLVDTVFPAENLDHADNVHDFGYNLNTGVRLQKKEDRNEMELYKVNGGAWPTIFIFSCWTPCILEATHPGRG